MHVLKKQLKFSQNSLTKKKKKKRKKKEFSRNYPPHNLWLSKVIKKIWHHKKMNNFCDNSILLTVIGREQVMYMLKR